jgi:outer membrane biosynthesis protein TonB
MLERSLTRYHQKPAPFFGTVLSDAVDIPAVDAIWRGNPDQPQPAPEAVVPRPPDPPNASPPAQPSPPASALTPTEPQPQPDPPPDPAADPAPDAPAPDAATTSEWTRTPLDSGPGWSREVLRHRSSTPGGNGSIPGAAAR